ncbi:hypothetical protein [Rhodococcus sp. NPDC047139]|uniref:hypothetical protein n=1 Tax=Rhodococcus sp. NPDC047139 TaxID=3155141 RepID=UPI0033F2CFDB
MIEAVLGLHARDDEPVEPRSGPDARIDDDTGVGGISLERLLEAATLTAAQAALLVTDVVDQLELAHGRDRYPTSLRSDAATVSESGHLTIECDGPARSWDDLRAAVSGVLRQIATNCRSAALADRVDESIAESSDLAGLARSVRRSAAKEFDPSEVERKRSQLAALVAAVLGRDHPESHVDRTDVSDKPLPAKRSSLASSTWHPPVGKVWHRKKRRPSRLRGLLALLAVLALVGSVWAAPTAWSELKRGWSALLDPVETPMSDQISPVSPPPPEPEVAPPPAEPGAVEPGPVDTGLPGAAGPITRVAATFANGACEAGRSCTIRVDIGVDPAANVGAVTWNLTVYDRCTGDVRPGGEVTVPTGGQEAYGIGRVDLPADSAFGIAATTSVPAAAASEPVYVPVENATCPPGDSDAGR